MVLSPLEYDQLFYSTGKLSLGEITGILWEKYQSAYESRKEFLGMVDRVMRLADRRFWITVFCFEDTPVREF